MQLASIGIEANCALLLSDGSVAGLLSTDEFGSTHTHSHTKFRDNVPTWLEHFSSSDLSSIREQRKVHTEFLPKKFIVKCGARLFFLAPECEPFWNFWSLFVVAIHSDCQPRCRARAETPQTIFLPLCGLSALPNTSRKSLLDLRFLHLNASPHHPSVSARFATSYKSMLP